MLPYTLSLSTEILDKIENASSWESLEIILQDTSVIASTNEIYKEKFDFFFPTDLTKASHRSYFVELIRTIYGITKSAKDKQFTDKSYDPFYHQHTFFADEITIHVRGIRHDHLGLIKAAKKLQKKSLLICEPGLTNYFKKAENVLEIPRGLELTYLRAKEYINLYYSFPEEGMWQADPILSTIKKGIIHFKNKENRNKEKTKGDPNEEERREMYLRYSAPLPSLLEKKKDPYITNNGKVIVNSDYSCFFRSLAQGEYALKTAKEKGVSTVDLLIGAAHAEDMKIIYGLPEMREKIIREGKKRSDTFLAKQFRNIPKNRFEDELIILHTLFWGVSFSELAYQIISSFF